MESKLIKKENLTNIGRIGVVLGFGAMILACASSQPSTPVNNDYDATHALNCNIDSINIVEISDLDMAIK